jgi:hypothetical protein
MSMIAASLFSLVFIVIGGAMISYAVKGVNPQYGFTTILRISPNPSSNPAARAGSTFYMFSAGSSRPLAFSS